MIKSIIQISIQPNVKCHPNANDMADDWHGFSLWVHFANKEWRKSSTPLEACKSNTGYSVKFISHVTKNLGFWVYKVVQIWPGLVRLVYTQISPGHIWTTLYFTKTVLLMTFSEIIVSCYQKMRKVPTRCEGNIQRFYSAKSDWVYLSLVSDEIKNLAQFCTQTK
jgi:hypothetical protein